MVSSVVFKVCDGGIVRQIQLKKTSPSYRVIMAFFDAELQAEPGNHDNTVRSENRTHAAQCDGCATKPIAGVRYKCVLCEDYDLCAKCEARGLHDHHVMLRSGRVLKETAEVADATRNVANNAVGSQTEPVAAKRVLKVADSEASQRTENDTSSAEKQLEEDAESEAAEQRPAPRHLCPYCDYSTPRKYCLDNHVRTHTGSKPFRCAECGYRAAQKGNLATHLRSHTGEKPHACHYRNCGFRGVQKSDLDTHIRTHTGEKPHKCPYPECPFRSADKRNVVRHVRNVHRKL